MNDFVCVGDATIDAFLSIHDANLHCRLNEKDCELCIKYGEKIPVDKFELSLGGIASNVSVGLSRMGLRSVLCAEIGDDELSQKIANDLKKENVKTDLLLKTRGATASFAVGINFKGERTLFVGHVKRKHDFNLADISTQWVYLGGLGDGWKAPYRKILDYVQKNNLRLAFTPGSSQLEELGETVFAVLKKTEVLFVNKEEAIKILNIKENYPSKILVQLQRISPKIVVITDGKNGSCAIDENGVMYRLGTFPAKVVERTGAGDAYASGFLSALIFGRNVSEAMRFGAVNASSVIEHVGAQRGLLGREEVEKRLTDYPEFQAKEV
ncbi:MAG: carbohydrate kinase family protein [Candidatus Levybacteria bacterium]|nr:carbohydrate kinase family protein [Candidatus Levybacteria bacterium]MBI3092716.1 carbohydrate kinase family protein [Candidatus Levybacteria bacterium]